MPRIATHPGADGALGTDESDNCLDVSNASQVDADRDGFGNTCDGDFDQSGATVIADFVTLRAGLGRSLADADYDPAFDMDASGAVTVAELLLWLERLGGAPGPSGLSCAGAVPCGP